MIWQKINVPRKSQRQNIRDPNQKHVTYSGAHVMEILIILYKQQ